MQVYGRRETTLKTTLDGGRRAILTNKRSRYVVVDRPVERRERGGKRVKHAETWNEVN